MSSATSSAAAASPSASSCAVEPQREDTTAQRDLEALIASFQQQGENATQADGRNNATACHQQRPSKCSSPRTELPRDVLHHLYTFLTLKEMALTARTQKRWLAGAISMKPRGDFFSLHPQLVWDSVFTSPLRHHVASLSASSTQVQPLERFHRIVDTMPHLTHLSASLLLQDGMPPLRWPLALKQLSVRVVGLESDALQGCLGRSIAANLAHLRLLHIESDTGCSCTPLLQPLEAMPALTDLQLRVVSDASMHSKRWIYFGG
jgi:hypothetical protein